METLNVTLQQALSRPLPAAIDLVLTGHVHLAGLLSFGGNRPPQAVVGIGGTLLLPGVTRGIVGMHIDGDVVSHATVISTHGFFTFQPRRHNAWDITIRHAAGTRPMSCVLENRTLVCPTN